MKLSRRVMSWIDLVWSHLLYNLVRTTIIMLVIKSTGSFYHGSLLGRSNSVTNVAVVWLLDATYILYSSFTFDTQQDFS